MANDPDKPKTTASAIASVKAAPVASTTAATDLVTGAERQPDEFPVVFDDWAAAQRAYAQTLVAGFRHTVRREGKLLTPQYRREWQAAFEAYQNSPPA